MRGKTMSTLSWWVTSAGAGIVGAAAHSALMITKDRLQLLPNFQPYEIIQIQLADFFGGSLHPLAAIAVWLFSRATIVGLWDRHGLGIGDFERAGNSPG
jgi:hypothetical protein